MRIGTTSSAEIILQNGSGDSSVHSWGWADNGWGVAGAPVYFASSGTHTLRVQQREDGAIVDQIVLSPGTYISAAPEKVWAALAEIPAGQTRSYGEQAARIGHPTAVRAVGLANGANPISLVLPCHRVIGSDGSLTGYGGGLERKRWLLEHEGALSVPHPLFAPTNSPSSRP